MKHVLSLLLLFVFASPHLGAADLPTVTIDHLYYLRARAESLKKMSPDVIIDYCVAQKLGGPGFESLYAQIFSLRIERSKLLRIDEISGADARLVSLNKALEAHLALLREEAQRIQSGLLREGQIATDTLEAMARAQNAR